MEDLFGASHSNKTFKSSDILGPNLLNYYHRPIQTTYQIGDIVTEPVEEREFNICDEFDETLYKETDKFLNKSTQTDYRESYAQTDPWDPPYKVIKINKEPDVLLLKELTYGNGLPATMLEVEYIAKTCKNSNLIGNLKENLDHPIFKEETNILSNQIKNNWNYKIAVNSEIQAEKLELLKSSLVGELKKSTEKRQHILKNMWERKNKEMNKTNIKLEKKLEKDKKNVEHKFLDVERNPTRPNTPNFKLETHSDLDKQLTSEEYVDCLLNDYFLSSNEGLSNVKNWLENKQTVLKNKVSLPRYYKRSQQERLKEEAYQDILLKKKTKLPPKVYYEDYEREQPVIPVAKPDDPTEFLKFEEKKIDMVTVWQQILRGLAYQTQMLNLIEKHKDGLSVALSKKIFRKKH